MSSFNNSTRAFSYLSALFTEKTGRDMKSTKYQSSSSYSKTSDFNFFFVFPHVNIASILLVPEVKCTHFHF